MPPLAEARSVDLPQLSDDELQLLLFSLQQYVGEYRKRMPFFDDAGYRLQRFQQGITVDLQKFHDVLL